MEAADSPMIKVLSMSGRNGIWMAAENLRGVERAQLPGNFPRVEDAMAALHRVVVSAEEEIDEEENFWRPGAEWEEGDDTEAVEEVRRMMVDEGREVIDLTGEESEADELFYSPTSPKSPTQEAVIDLTGSDDDAEML